MKLPVLFLSVLCLTVGAAGQTGSWLDANPLRNWNTANNRLPVPDRRARPNVAQCRRYARPSTLFADNLVVRAGMLPVGEASVFGKITVVTAAKDFDGMCRPNDFQTFVFSGSKLVGTLSPVLMDSRTDGALQTVSLPSETMVIARYSRYKEDDALCCPSSTALVTFDITNGVLVPSGSDSSSPTGASLAGSKWRWESTETAGKVVVKRPDDYTVEFLAGGSVNVRSDCNRGRGKYTANGAELRFGAIALTRMACPRGSQDNIFNRGLADARSYAIAGNMMTIDLETGGTMHFRKLP